MDLQTRKLNAIEYLLSIDSENAISNIESIILQNRISDNQLFTPFTKEELIERAKKIGSRYSVQQINFFGRFATSN